MTPSKTAQQRAQEALDVAERRVKGYLDAIHKNEAERVALDKKLATAKSRRNYAAKHPDLSTSGIIEVGPTDPEAGLKGELQELAKSFESSHKAPDPTPTEQS